jgi:hypothetical protein
MQPDAATRPQDRADFDTQIWLECYTGLYLAVRLIRHLLERSKRVLHEHQPS